MREYNAIAILISRSKIIKIGDEGKLSNYFDNVLYEISRLAKIEQDLKKL